MFSIDFMTVIVAFGLVNIVCLGVMGWLWSTHKAASPEMSFWLADYIMQAAAFGLLLARGAVPDLLSIVGANALVIAGSILLLIGLQRYVGRSSAQVHNWIVLGVFVAIHAYLTYGYPSLRLRNVNLALTMAFVLSQAVWLMLGEARRGRRGSAGVGYALLAIGMLSVIRVVADLTGPSVAAMASSPFVDGAIVLSQAMLFVVLTFTLVLMVQRRLLGDLELDIEAREVAGRLLRQSEENFSTAFRNHPDGIALTARDDGRVIEVNDAMARLVGRPKEDLVGETSLTVGVWPTLEDRERYLDALERDGSVRGMETVFGSDPGQRTPVLLSGEVLEIDGEPCILTIVRDISEFKRSQGEVLRLNAELEERVAQRTEQLAAANEDLEEVNERLRETIQRLETATRAKSDFLAAMSHELRTPLNSIIGFSGMLAGGMVGELEPEQASQVRIINASGKYLLQLVSEILNLSAIDAGKIVTQFTRIDVSGLAHGVIESMRPLAAAKALDLKVEIDSTHELISDRLRLEQVLLNLLGNAIKFTAVGQVGLSVTDAPGEVVFAVSDTGVGIDEETREHIFDEFYQAPQVDIAKSAGTGLGLTVSRRLLDLLGGTITVESVVGEGTTFTVRVPVTPSVEAGS